MELEQLLSLWEPARLVLFLKVRNVSVPKGVSKKELVDLVISKRDVPIVDVKISKKLLASLTQEQLIDYLVFRGYVVLNKGKIFPTIPQDYVKTQEADLLAAALKDFETNYTTIPEELDDALEKVLNKTYAMSVTDGFLLGQTEACYTDLTLDNVLKRFGQEWVAAKTLDSKWELAHACVNFFNTGVY